MKKSILKEPSMSEQLNDLEQMLRAKKSVSETAKSLSEEVIKFVDEDNYYMSTYKHFLIEVIAAIQIDPGLRERFNKLGDASKKFRDLYEFFERIDKIEGVFEYAVLARLEKGSITSLKMKRWLLIKFAKELKKYKDPLPF